MENQKFEARQLRPWRMPVARRRPGNPKQIQIIRNSNASNPRAGSVKPRIRNGAQSQRRRFGRFHLFRVSDFDIRFFFDRVHRPCIDVNKKTNKLRRFLKFITPCPAKTKENLHKRWSTAASGGGAGMLRCPCTAETQHLVFLASIVSEKRVSPQTKRNCGSRRDAGAQSS